MEQNRDERVKGMDLTLFDLFYIFTKNKKNILYPAAIAAVITAFVVFFIVDPIFLSYGTIKTSGKVVGLNSAAMSEVTELGEVIGGGGYAKELALYENILNSRACIEAAINKFNYMEKNEYPNMQLAVKDFRDNIMYVQSDKIAGVMEIGVYDKDPVLAREVSDFLIVMLNKINTELNQANARNQREFIEARYYLATQELASAEDSLKIYQDFYGLSPDMQFRQASQVELQLETELQSEEIKLNLLKKVIGPGEQEVQLQEAKIGEIRNKLAELQYSTDGSSKLRLKGVPDIVLRFLRLQRRVEIQTRILEILLPLFEEAKIEEKKEIPSVLVMDKPFVPDIKAKPKRLTITVLSFIMAAAALYAFYFLKYQVEKNASAKHA